MVKNREYLGKKNSNQGVPHKNLRPFCYQVADWILGGFEPNPGSLSSVTEAKDPYQTADPRAAGAGASPDHPAERATGQEITALTEEQRRDSDHVGKFEKMILMK
jgi:hypothetical protein